MTDNNQLLREQYQDASNFNARVRLARFNVNKQGWARWVFEQLNLPSAGRVLELGCGPAYLWLANRARLPADLAVVLTDFSPGMLAQARSNLAQTGRDYASVVADAQEIPLSAASCDVVIANHMLYHVPDRERTYVEVRRVLRPGGRFYASTLGRGHMHEVAELLHRYRPDANLDPYFLRGISFNLENGAAELARWFPAVELRRYDDAYLLTEAEPLVDYFASMLPARSPLLPERRARLTDFIQHELEANGPMHISKDTGLFVAGV